MPTYEYECSKCGNKFDKFQSMIEEHLKSCPECGAAVKRLIGKGSGIIFKGSGFYATDHRKPHKENGKETPKKTSEKESPSCGGCPESGCSAKKD